MRAATRLIVLKRRWPAGLVHLWNADRPTSRLVGPYPVYSAASQQPDANGDLVDWPNYIAGKGVIVHPAYTNMLQNSKLQGAVSGTPGTKPTNWTGDAANGTLTVNSNGSITTTVATNRYIIPQNITVLANTTYYASVNVIADGVLTYDQIFSPGALPSGTIYKYVDSGGPIVGSTTVPFAGSHTLFIKAIVGATGGTWGIRFGAGCGGTATGTCTVWRPQVTANYEYLYLASSPGSTASVASTAATSAGNGLAIPMDSRMTAALGGIFTAAAIVNMRASSAEVTADTNILAVNNNITGGIYMAASGILKVFDGTNTATVTVTGGWARDDEILIVWWINGAGTNQQIGYKKSAESAITWGAAAAYDGSVNPGTHLRYGYTIDKSLGIIHSHLWNKSVGTDAEILDMIDRYVN